MCLISYIKLCTTSKQEHQWIEVQQGTPTYPDHASSHIHESNLIGRCATQLCQLLPQVQVLALWVQPKEVPHGACTIHGHNYKERRQGSQQTDMQYSFSAAESVESYIGTVCKVCTYSTMYSCPVVQNKIDKWMPMDVYCMCMTFGVHVRTCTASFTTHHDTPPFPPLPSPPIPLTNHFHLHKLFHWEREGKEREGVKPDTCIATLAALQLRLQLKEGTETKAHSMHHTQTWTVLPVNI